jgi:hypothetical protein
MTEARSAEDTVRTVLGLVGGVLVTIGVIVMIIAFQDFASAGMGHQPTKFWMFFIGMPLLFVGMTLLQVGFNKDGSGVWGVRFQQNRTDSQHFIGSGLNPAIRGGVRHSDHSYSPNTPFTAIPIPPPDYVKEGRDGAPDEGSGKPKGSVRERLEKLDSLHKDGLIDDQDFEMQKDRILKDL